MEEIQECICCRVVKPLSDYYKHKAMANGHLGKCKECSKIATKNHYTKNILKTAEYDKNRNGNDKRKKRRVERQKELRLLYPEKHKARKAVSNAVRDGKLLKQPCECCGESKTEAHHDDYTKPLDVKWFCFSCHLRYHNKKLRITVG